MRTARIEGLNTMDCAEIVEALGTIIANTAMEAAKLSTEIETAYTEKDAAEAEMHQAAEIKDMTKYKGARMRFDMLTEYIAQAEHKLSVMRDGRIIDKGDAAEIKGRMFTECDAATAEAAKEINGLFDQAKEITEKLNGKIAERNKVLLALSGCTRPKDAAGEPTPPDYYREVIVGPYLHEIKMMQSPNKAAFNSFVRRAEITK